MCRIICLALAFASLASAIWHPLADPVFVIVLALFAVGYVVNKVTDARKPAAPKAPDNSVTDGT